MPAGGPCFCDQMTGGSDLVVSPAVPALVSADPVVSAPIAARSYQWRVPLPSSPSFAPTPPPPDRLG
jgi:hypothetical protein